MTGKKSRCPRCHRVYKKTEREQHSIIEATGPGSLPLPNQVFAVVCDTCYVEFIDWLTLAPQETR